MMENGQDHDDDDDDRDDELYDDHVYVDDEEGGVDQKVKTAIINARNRVDKAEQALFVRGVLEPTVDINRQQQVVSWGTIVRQFLRRIEPLLADDDVEGAQYYYHEFPIGRMRLSPPPTDGYDFSLVDRVDAGESELRRMLGLPRGASIPKPEEVVFVGLQDVIESDDVIEQQWSVKIDASGAPAQHEYVYPSVERVIGKNIYEEAIRAADQFLQTCGIGVETTAPDYMGGGEPGL